VLASARRPAILVLVALVLAGGVAVAVALLGGGDDDLGGPAGRPSGPAAISGTAYYVSPDGSDDSDGTSPDRAWATLARAGRVRLRPGDGVLLRGGAAFADADLEVSASGTSAAPVVFGSYGGGRARLTRSVVLRGASFVVVQDLDVRDVDQGIVSAASSPSGSRGVVVQRNRIGDAGIAIHSTHEADADWVVRGNDIANTRDSALIVVGSGAQISGNDIENAGFDESIDYGKHGIYLKGAHGVVTGNRIRGFPGGSAVSIRRHDSRVEGNELAGGLIGISWFQEDAGAGTSRWRDNRISGTTSACIYVSPSDAAGQTRESFVITGNVLSRAGGRYLNLAPSAGTYRVQGNRER
jgi:hypothetical protein